MKKALLIILLVFCFSFYSFGQQKRPLPTNTDLFPRGGTLTHEQDLPLIIIGTLETNASSLVMDQDNLRIVKIYDEPKELKFFGEKGNSGIMVAELKTRIPLLRLDEVLDHYNVPDNNRHLPVLVDKRSINPALFLADVKKIQKLEVFEVTEEDVVLSLVYNRWTKGDKYLNIVTKQE